MSREGPAARGRSGAPPGGRVVWAALAGAAAVAIPLAVYFVFAPLANDWWLIPWVVTPVLGPLVFELLSRPRPEWWHGLAFGAALGLVFGVWGGIDPPFADYSGAAQQAFIGALFFAMTFIGGMAGASVASLIGRAKRRPR